MLSEYYTNCVTIMKTPLNGNSVKNKVVLPYGLLCFMLIVLTHALAQSPQDRGAAGGQIVPVDIGLKVPEEFWTKNHLFFVNGDTVRRSLQEHRGKTVILDFWFSGCVRCLLDQKQITKFTQEYKDNLVVVMVNSKLTRESYEKLKTLYDQGYFARFGITHFETVMDDEYLLSLFPHAVYPHYVWINSIERPELKTSRNLLDETYVPPFINAP